MRLDSTYAELIHSIEFGNSRDNETILNQIYTAGFKDYDNLKIDIDLYIDDKLTDVENGGHINEYVFTIKNQEMFETYLKSEYELKSWMDLHIDGGI